MGALISALAVLIAIWVAAQGQMTVNHNSQNTLRQSEDSQLSTAITALGSKDVTERIAGLILLEHNTSARLTQIAQTGEPASEVYDDYATALQVLSGYLQSHGVAGSGQTPLFGRGYGAPSRPGIIPIDVAYATDQVRILLSKQTKKEVRALNTGKMPAIDLSYDELFQVSWSGIHFSWVTAYMPGIDMRGADLSSSTWSGKSDLSGSYLQCADLRRAVLRGANLTHADLRGANVQGADFQGAHLKDAQLASLYGTPLHWPRSLGHITTLPAKEWNPQACLTDKKFWDNQPPMVSTPAPKASSSPTHR